MKAELLKYKHHLLMLLALLLANYLLMPLTELQEEQLQIMQLLEKKQNKTAQLIDTSADFTQQKTQVTGQLEHASGYLYTQETAAEFKLTSQNTVESILKVAGCNISRIGFKGNQQVFPQVQKWFIDVRYRGDVMCLLNVTRAIETAKPYINIEEYSYSARDFDEEADATFNASLQASVWYKVKAETEGGE